MKPFMDADFLLQTDIARWLYHDVAKKMPIIDYHCHVDANEIAQDRRFANIAQIWLGADHYKWKLMRAAGVEEALITGDSASDYEKFEAFASVMPKAIGNPVYHWAHLELRRYFDCDLILSAATAKAVWEMTKEKLKQEGMSVRGLIAQSAVEVIATTDDPCDALEAHKAIAAESRFSTQVLPSFRPDRAIHIEQEGFSAYISLLSQVTGVNIACWDDLLTALADRIDYFVEAGCKTADHGLDYAPFAQSSASEPDRILKKVLAGGTPTDEETQKYQTALLRELGKRYKAVGWVMQLHYGAIRNVNKIAFAALGADAGYDAINARDSSANLAKLLDDLNRNDGLPKTVLYALNPNDDAALDVIAGCFPSPGVEHYVQHGSAWWFNDTKQGMEAQLSGFASRGLLGGFIGMLTDSRSFLSYTRHEYFRRILCNYLGDLVDAGEYPADALSLESLTQDICYYNVKRYFGF